MLLICNGHDQFDTARVYDNCAAMIVRVFMIAAEFFVVVHLPPETKGISEIPVWIAVEGKTMIGL